MDGDEENDEMASLTFLELSDPDVQTLDDLDVKFTVLPIRIFIDHQAMDHFIFDKTSDRILGVLAEIYLWMKGVTFSQVWTIWEGDEKMINQGCEKMHYHTLD